MLWEYKTAINDLANGESNDSKIFNITETDVFLNIMGKDNWELVDVNPIVSNGNTMKFAYFFKRPIINNTSTLPDIGFDIDHNGFTGSQR